MMAVKTTTRITVIIMVDGIRQLVGMIITDHPAPTGVNIIMKTTVPGLPPHVMNHQLKIVLPVTLTGHLHHGNEIPVERKAGILKKVQVL